MHHKDDLDWPALVQRVQEFLRGRLQNLSAHTDDLCQDVLVTLWKKIQDQEIDDPFGYAIEIAKNRLGDFFRSMNRTRGKKDLELPEEDQFVDMSQKNPLDALCDTGDRADRIRFAVMSFFEKHDAQQKSKGVSCRQIAVLILKGAGLKQIHEDQMLENITYDSLRQKWSRCMKNLKLAFADGLGDFL